MIRVATKPQLKFPSIPPGWLTMQEFAARCGLPVNNIRMSVRRGHFPSIHLAKAPHGKDGVRGPADVVIINYNEAVYDYLATRKSDCRPDDFVENEAREYKPIRLTTETEAPQTLPEIIKENVVNPDEPVPMVDLSSAKLRHEQLKVRKLEAELSQIANKTVKIEDVIATNTACAIEVRQALQGARRRMVPLLLGVKTSREIDAILEAEIHKALEALAAMEG